MSLPKLVSAHKSLDPAAGAGFLAARRPCVACGCLRASPSCRLVLDFQHMTRRHTVGRVHEIEQKKTREPDAEQVRHEDRERDADVVLRVGEALRLDLKSALYSASTAAQSIMSARMTYSSFGLSFIPQDWLNPSKVSCRSLGVLYMRLAPPCAGTSGAPIGFD